jgi:hypothetical protein
MCKIGKIAATFRHNLFLCPNVKDPKYTYLHIGMYAPLPKAKLHEMFWVNDQNIEIMCLMYIHGKSFLGIMLLSKTRLKFVFSLE